MTTHDGHQTMDGQSTLCDPIISPWTYASVYYKEEWHKHTFFPMNHKGSLTVTKTTVLHIPLQ